MSNQMRPVIIKSFEELNKAEFYQIVKLRIEGFIVEQNCPYPDLDDKDQEAHHMWIEDTGEIVCYLRINPAGSRFAEPSLGRIVTKRSHRKQGLAEVLINKAIHFSAFNDISCRRTRKSLIRHNYPISIIKDLRSINIKSVSFL